MQWRIVYVLIRMLFCVFICDSTREMNAKTTVGWAHKQLGITLRTLFHFLLAIMSPWMTIKINDDKPGTPGLSTPHPGAILTHWGRFNADDTFKCIFFTENVRISMNIPLKFVPKWFGIIYGYINISFINLSYLILQSHSLFDYPTITSIASNGAN